MKKHYHCGMLGIFAALGAAPALGQSNVQVYGLIDTAIEHVTNTAPGGASLTRMPNLSGGQFPSRLGFRGTEDLGNGLKAIFTLENGFGPDTGTLNQGGRLFGRQAWVGLSGDWGQLTVGRTYSMLFYTFFDTDVIGTGQYSIGSIDPIILNLRNDNSISYKGKWQGFTLGGGYTFGRDVSNAGGPGGTNCAGESAADSKACRGWNAMLAYDSGNWGATAGYDTYNGGPGAAPAFAPTRSDRADSRWHVGAYAKLGPAKVGGGLLHRNNEGNAVTPRSDLIYLGVSYGIAPAFVLDAQIARLDVKASPNDANLCVVRGTYHLSKRTAVYAALGKSSNSGTAAIALSAGATVVAGGAQNGVMAGMRHSF